MSKHKIHIAETYCLNIVSKYLPNKKDKHSEDIMGHCDNIFMIVSWLLSDVSMTSIQRHKNISINVL